MERKELKFKYFALGPTPFRVDKSGVVEILESSDSDWEAVPSFTAAELEKNGRRITPSSAFLDKFCSAGA